MGSWLVVMADAPPEVSPSSSWSVIVAGAALGISLTSLIVTIILHYLQGGRIKVELRSALFGEQGDFSTLETGDWKIDDTHPLFIDVGRMYFEVAIVRVINCGRTPVTVSAPQFRVQGTGLKNHTFGPFTIPKALGHQSQAAGGRTRIEPYGEAEYLYDYWPGILSIRRRHPGATVTLRAQARVAGRRSTQKSRRRTRWTIPATAVSSRVLVKALPPVLVMWRTYMRERSPSASTSKRKHPVPAGALIAEAMRGFTDRPEPDEFAAALRKAWDSWGGSKKDGRVPLAGSLLSSLSDNAGHLDTWGSGL